MFVVEGYIVQIKDGLYLAQGQRRDLPMTEKIWQAFFFQTRDHAEFTKKEQGLVKAKVVEVEIKIKE